MDARPAATVGATWLATMENDSVLCRDHGPELDLAPLSVELAFALVAVRALDLEIFDGRSNRAYQTLRASRVEGRVVEGFTLMRNADIHLPSVVDPGIDRALSVPVMPPGQVWPFRGQFRLFPFWRPFDDLPADVRETKLTANRCKESYREHVAGKLILDTLLDAVRFFYECDPSVAAVDGSGELLHFPLPTVLPTRGDRRHPLAL